MGAFLLGAAWHPHSGGKTEAAGALTCYTLVGYTDAAESNQFLHIAAPGPTTACPINAANWEDRGISTLVPSVNPFQTTKPQQQERSPAPAWGRR